MGRPTQGGAGANPGSQEQEPRWVDSSSGLKVGFGLRLGSETRWSSQAGAGVEAWPEPGQVLGWPQSTPDRTEFGANQVLVASQSQILVDC